MNSLVVGVDIGGSHITAALIDMEKRQIQRNTLRRQLVNSSASLEEIISKWCAAIKECTTAITDGEVYIGIAMPGPFDYIRGISLIKEQDKFSALYGVNIKQALANEIGVDSGKILFLNDAASFLKGEVFNGVAQNQLRVFGVTLGTGFGSALYRAGEAKDANLWCAPFKEGVAEDYFSTRWFTQRYAEKTGKQIKNVKSLAALYNDDVCVKEIFTEFGENLASFLSGIVQEEEPDLIVLGGNIAKSFPYFCSSLRKGLEVRGAAVPVKKSTLNEKASLLGAASCWAVKVEA